MRQVILGVFLALLVTETLGTGTFLAVYLRSSDWSSTPVGRHLVAYSAALLGLLALSLVSFLTQAMWLIWLILAFHVAFDVVIWQRVVLVWRAQKVKE